MDMHELHRHRLEKDHHMRYGHLSFEDRKALSREDEERQGFAKADGDYENKHLAMKRIQPRYGFLDQEDKQYHSPERPETMEGEY